MEGCWSGIDDGCELELGAVLGAVLGEDGVLCAIAKPLPSATINASLFKFLTSILRFPFSRFGPLGNRYAYTKDERRSSRNRGHFGCYRKIRCLSQARVGSPEQDSRAAEMPLRRGDFRSELCDLICWDEVNCCSSGSPPDIFIAREPSALQVDRQSSGYKTNYAAMQAAVERLRAELKRSTEGGGEKYVKRHLERGKLLPRDRVEMLLDEGSFFLEIAPLAGHGMENESPGAGVVGGVGLVCGRECLITANEATVKGGATGEAGLWKNARLADIARENHLPSILLVESAGADLPLQSKIFVAGGRGFREITRRSKERIPTISVVFGSSTAGGAYLPGMSDYVVMVKKQAQVFLAGPPLVKMATGEVSDEESLGGAEMHSRVSGLSDYLAEDELDAIRIAREIVSHFN